MTSTPLLDYDHNRVRAFLKELHRTERANSFVRYSDLLEAAGLPGDLIEDLTVASSKLALWHEGRGYAVTAAGHVFIADTARAAVAARPGYRVAYLLRLLNNLTEDTDIAVLVDQVGLPHDVIDDLLDADLLVWAGSSLRPTEDGYAFIRKYPLGDTVGLDNLSGRILDVVEESAKQGWDADELRRELLIAVGVPYDTALPGTVETVSDGVRVITVDEDTLLRSRRILLHKQELLKTLPDEWTLLDELRGIVHLLGEEHADDDR